MKGQANCKQFICHHLTFPFPRSFRPSHQMIICSFSFALFRITGKPGLQVVSSAASKFYCCSKIFSGSEYFSGFFGIFSILRESEIEIEKREQREGRTFLVYFHLFNSKYSSKLQFFQNSKKCSDPGYSPIPPQLRNKFLPSSSVYKQLAKCNSRPLPSTILVNFISEPKMLQTVESNDCYLQRNALCKAKH